MKFLVMVSSPSTFRARRLPLSNAGGLPPTGAASSAFWARYERQGCAVVETTDAKSLYAWVGRGV